MSNKQKFSGFLKIILQIKPKDFHQIQSGDESKLGLYYLIYSVNKNTFIYFV